MCEGLGLRQKQAGPIQGPERSSSWLEREGAKAGADKARKQAAASCFTARRTEGHVFYSVHCNCEIAHSPKSSRPVSSSPTQWRFRNTHVQSRTALWVTYHFYLTACHTFSSRLNTGLYIHPPPISNFSFPHHLLRYPHPET